MPRAILFDLDETLTDRMQSVVRYVERFQGALEAYLVPTACPRCCSARSGRCAWLLSA